MPKVRVLVGAGTASEVFLRTLDKDDWITFVVGPSGLWANMPRNGRMGQPPHLLQLPGQPVPKFQSPTGRTVQGLTGFMDVHTYQTGLQAVGTSHHRPGRHNLPNAKVTRVQRLRHDKLRVTFQGAGPLTGLDVDQVIIANGIGPQKTPERANIPVSGVPINTLGFKQIEEGTDYLTHPNRVARNVVVYGGGPTAAWVAAEVSTRAYIWFWGARVGGEGFSRSVLPGDRNSIILALANRQVRYTIVRARYVRAGQYVSPIDGKPVGPPQPQVELTLSAGNGEPEFPYYTDQLIYCIGGDPGAPGSVADILDHDLAGELEPLRDDNRMVSRDGNGVLAWASATRDLLIIGSATYNFTIPQVKAKQDAPMTWLPPNAQVPDGIALTVSVIETLNQYMPVTPRPGRNDGDFDWTLNFNTANRTQIAAYFAATTDLEPFVANVAVALIVHFRSTTARTFGITNHQVLHIVKAATQAVANVRHQQPGFEKLRALLEDHKKYPNGVDNFLDAFVRAMTRPRWNAIWTAAGLPASTQAD
jgi:hypothetical protein